MKKGTPHFLYTNKDSPDYVAPFAPFYSDRQKAILSGELSVEEVELRELGRLRNKARNISALRTQSLKTDIPANFLIRFAPCFVT